MKIDGEIYEVREGGRSAYSAEGQTPDFQHRGRLDRALDHQAPKSQSKRCLQLPCSWTSIRALTTPSPCSLALSSPEVELVGVSTVAGNVSLSADDRQHTAPVAMGGARRRRSGVRRRRASLGAGCSRRRRCTRRDRSRCGPSPRGAHLASGRRGGISAEHLADAAW